MKYVLSIDWLNIFCVYEGAGDWSPLDGDQLAPNFVRFSYKKEDFGTRCFSEFYRVRMPNDEGGIDEFAEVQAKPYSSILPSYVVMVRFVNRTLYLPNFWELAEEFLEQNKFSCRSISRIDICADFNQFETMTPKALIEGFASKKFRHIGRGVGALYFNHGIGVEKDEFDRPIKDYGVQYNGLSFGTHSSDAHVYLYNKTLELDTQSDKPWIRDIWSNAGLDVKHVWRLEVSIKAKGLKFKDRKTKMKIEVDKEMIKDGSELEMIYFTFIRRLFSFIINKKKISNITREPKLILFKDHPVYDRGVIRNLSPGNRTERIMIRQLYQFASKYRGFAIYDAAGTSQDLADRLAWATGLHDWFEEKQDEWEKPIHE